MSYKWTFRAPPKSAGSHSGNAPSGSAQNSTRCLRLFLLPPYPSVTESCSSYLLNSPWILPFPSLSFLSHASLHGHLGYHTPASYPALLLSVLLRSPALSHWPCKDDIQGMPGWLSNRMSAFGSGHDPAVQGSSPASGSPQGACFSLCLCLCLSLCVSHE